LNNMGSIYREQKETDQSIHCYQQAITHNQNHAEALNNLGAVLTEKEDPEQGIQQLEKAIQLRPHYAEAHRNAGSCYLLLEHYAKAETAFNLALNYKPDFAEAMLGLAALEQEANNYASAEKLIRQALTINNSLVAAHCQLAALQGLKGFPEQAFNHYEQALALDSQDISAHLGKSHLHTEQGQLDEAEHCLQQALILDPDSLAARLSLAQLKKVDADDSNFTALKTTEKTLGKHATTKAIALHFALGKCHDDIGDYKISFSHFLEACRLKREKIHYSKADNTLATLNIMSSFTPELIEKLQGHGHSSSLPIFILGMPRSGTTLTEQIIASHPHCHGAGELPDMSHIAKNLPEDQGIQKNTALVYPQTIHHVLPEQLAQLGEQYVRGLLSRQLDAHFITDKMPSNYFYLGLIHLILPNAKIIHVKRNPVDTCISGFSKLFKRGQHHSYDLTEQGHYYRDYANLMQHWREVLPRSAFYEIQYEDLVSDTERQARSLISYCGLEWDDACLQFHTHQRTVRTASVTQVRQPIYQTSVERWHRYENQLEPLLDALGNLVPERS
ncbi:MAG TPA: sulfotransferase family protein, partial [Porticoccus sp.]|nr:sulfotransferase family protein [Porticoccus sp.]